MIEKMKSLMLKLNYISCRFIGFTMGRFFMLALALTNKKDFMNKFLKTEIFDHFLLQEGVVVSSASYVIDGTITKGFYTDTEAEELGIKTFHFLPFSMLRPRIFDLIKGKKASSPCLISSAASSYFPSFAQWIALIKCVLAVPTYVMI